MNFVFYTNRNVREGFAGCAKGPFIFIRPEYRDDRGLLLHEQTHVKQFWHLPIIHQLMYLLHKPYRLKCEVAAYRAQANCYTADLRPFFADMISKKYNLDITQEAALKLLMA